ncbi:hypothetical protein GCM10017712_10110 [Curtobacterium citreum]
MRTRVTLAEWRGRVVPPGRFRTTRPARDGARDRTGSWNGAARRDSSQRDPVRDGYHPHSGTRVST